MRVGVTQYHYFINRINNKLSKLNIQLLEESIKIDKEVKYVILNRHLFTRLGLNVDKLLVYCKQGNDNVYKMYGMLSSVKMNEANLKAIRELITLVNVHYQKTTKVHHRYSILSEMPYTAFIYILRAYNLQNLRKILRGSNMTLGHQIGQIKLKEKPRQLSNSGHTTGIDYVATKKLKQEILDRNGTLYSPDNPNGEKYLVYHTSDTHIWYTFYPDSRCLSQNSIKYRFTPSNYGNINKEIYPTMDDYYKTLHTFNDVIEDDNIGIVQKQKVVEILNPNFSYSLK